MVRSRLIRSILAACLALVLAGIFVRLGFWQLERRGERRARNALMSSRLDAPPAPLTGATADTGIRFRRISVSGRPDYDRELILAGRSRNGAPGIHILTPVIIAADTAVLVNRGWVYSADGSNVNIARWREADSLAIDGYIELFSTDTGAFLAGRSLRVVRVLRHADVAQRMPYVLLPYYVVALDPHGGREGDDPRLRQAPIDPKTPVRLPLPSLGDGPHLSYAIQWFSFAIIAIVGVGLLIRVETRA